MSLPTKLKTTTSLLTHFQTTLTSPPADQTSSISNEPRQKDVLPLLSTTTTALRSQVTKLSLLTITTPFTPSALNTVLDAVNESVLPSLVTVSLLLTSEVYTTAFRNEMHILARTVFRELGVLVGEVGSIAELKDQEKKDGKKEAEMEQGRKDVITAATGRVWDSCDALTDVADLGVVGFVVRRVEEWRDLVRDAVEEIQEWVPGEEDGFFDDLLGEEKETVGDGDEEDEDDEEKDTEALTEHKTIVLRICKPVSQIYPAIITNRLKNTGDAQLASIDKVESLMSSLKSIPEQIDEVAGALYEADLDKSTQFLKEVRASAERAVGLVALPWDAAKDGQEDKFTAWSRTWLKVMGEVSKSIDEKSTVG